MSITITKQPTGIYPAYNDSFIEFTSDLADNVRAEITVFPLSIFTRVFNIFPDTHGVYLFNLKEAVKVILNQNGFDDENFDTAVWHKSITGLYLLQDVQIKVISANEEFTNVVPVDSRFDDNTVIAGERAGIWEIRFKGGNSSIEKLTDDGTYFKIFLDRDLGYTNSLWSFDDFDTVLRGEVLNMKFSIKGDVSGLITILPDKTGDEGYDVLFTDQWQEVNINIIFGNSFNPQDPDQMPFLFLNRDVATTFYIKDLEILSDTSSETTLESYEFFKSVKQIGEPLHGNNLGVLTYSEDGINHYMSYFEGFPFHFDLKRVSGPGNIIKIKNLNTGNEIIDIDPAENDSFRFNIDRGGGKNWTSENVLPLIEGVNRLEIYENDVFKSNLLINKKKKCKGVYLKWWNRNGGYSHYLFNQYYVSQIKGEEVGKVLNDEFLNIGEATGINKSVGKNAYSLINIKAKYDNIEHENMKDILTSPLVQMYSSEFENVEGKYIDVTVNGTISNSNKRAKNEIAIVVELPEVITAKL